jgi:hypothetical protein
VWDVLYANHPLFPFNCEESDILFPSERAIDRPSILGLFDSLWPQVYELLQLFTDFIKQLMFATP